MTVKYVKVKDIDKWKISNDQGIETRDYHSTYFSKDKWVFLTKNEQKLWDKITLDSSKLDDDQIADPFTGIQSSRDSVYVIKKWKENGNYIEFNKKGTARQIEKGILKPYLLPGNLQREAAFKSFETKTPDGWIIFPYEVVNGKAKTLPESTLKSKFPNAWAYLNDFKDTLSERDLDQHSTDWYRFGRSQSLTRIENQPKIIVGVLFKEERYIYDESNMYFQTGDTAGYVGIKMRDNSLYSIYYVLGLLNHKALEWVSSKRASVFQRDYIAHGQTLLRELPIKKIDFQNITEKAKHDEITKLVQDLIETYKNLKQSKTPRNEQKILDEIKTKRITLENTINELYDIQSLIKYAD